MTKRNESGGETIPAQGDRQQRVPRAPHERDESASSQTPDEPTAGQIGRQAKKDLDRGLVDTDKRPQMDRAYESQKK